MKTTDSDLKKLFALMFQAHPWHGVTAGDAAPNFVNVYIEIVPNDAGVDVVFFDQTTNELRQIRADKAIFAAPLFIAAHQRNRRWERQPAVAASAASSRASWLNASPMFCSCRSTADRSIRSAVCKRGLKAALTDAG